MRIICCPLSRSTSRERKSCKANCRANQTAGELANASDDSTWPNFRYRYWPPLQLDHHRAINCVFSRGTLSGCEPSMECDVAMVSGCDHGAVLLRKYPGA